jgi:hypothetical protein
MEEIEEVEVECLVLAMENPVYVGGSNLHV